MKLTFPNIPFLITFSITVVIGCGIWAKNIPTPPVPRPMGEKQHSFGIEGRHFVFSGQPGVIISGSFHYPRVPRAYWRDRMKKARAPRHPHQLVLDLGKQELISALVYFPRADSKNGRIKQYRIYASKEPFDGL